MSTPSRSFHSPRRTLAAWAVVAALSATAFARAAAPVSVASPDGKIRIDVQMDDAGQLTWSVQRQGRTLLAPAPLGLTVDGTNIGQAVKLEAPRTRKIHEQYPTVGNHSLAVNDCNEAIIPAQCAGGIKYELELRSFNDGAAIRYHVLLDATSHTITGESTSWALPAGSSAWWMRYDNSYEKTYETGTLDAIPARTALGPPLTFKTPDKVYVALTDADNTTFPDMGVERDGAFITPVFPASARGWKQDGPILTPWRVATIADDLTALVNSDILTNLCPPPSAELASGNGGVPAPPSSKNSTSGSTPPKRSASSITSSMTAGATGAPRIKTSGSASRT